MTQKSVLFTTYPEAFLAPGGGETEVKSIALYLRRLGLKIDYYGFHSFPMSKYDILLHYSIEPSGFSFVSKARELGKKIVLILGNWWTQQPSPEDINNAQQFIALADFLIFKSQSELSNFNKYLEVPERKVIICRWGIDESYSYDTDANLFKKRFGIEDYILSVGCLEEARRQLSTIKAVNDLQYPLVFIGGSRSRNYYELCQRSGSTRVRYIDFLQPASDVLRSAYCGAKAYVEVSPFPAGYSALEAGSSGCPLVLGENPWSREIFGNYDVEYASADSHIDIRTKVEKALEKKRDVSMMTFIRSNFMLPRSLEPIAFVLK